MGKKIKIDLLNISRFLPRTPGILRKDEYFNSAVLIPFVYIKDEYHLLFEKRSAHIRQGGEICFPGGEVDRLRDSDILETAVRETCEELGVTRDQISVIGCLDTFVGSMGVTVDSFLAELKINDISILEIDKTEVEKVFAVPLSFFFQNEPEIYELQMEVHPFYKDEKGTRVELFPAKQLKLPERYYSSWKLRKHKVWVYKTGEEVIWGITAALLKEVIRIFTKAAEAQLKNNFYI